MLKNLASECLQNVQNVEELVLRELWYNFRNWSMSLPSVNTLQVREDFWISTIFVFGRNERRILVCCLLFTLAWFFGKIMYLVTFFVLNFLACKFVISSGVLLRRQWLRKQLGLLPETKSWTWWLSTQLLYWVLNFWHPEHQSWTTFKVCYCHLYHTTTSSLTIIVARWPVHWKPCVTLFFPLKANFGCSCCCMGTGMKELPQSGLFAYLHVEDLAQIHISALEITKASGRYICYERVVSEFELVELIRKLYPERSVPSRYFILCTHTR